MTKDVSISFKKVIVPGSGEQKRFYEPGTIKY